MAAAFYFTFEALREARWESWQISTVKLDGRFDIQYERVGDTAESHQQIMLFFFPQHRMSEAAASGREKHKLTKPSAVVFTSMVLYFLVLRLAIRNGYRSFLIYKNGTLNVFVLQQNLEKTNDGTQGIILFWLGLSGERGLSMKLESTPTG